MTTRHLNETIPSDTGQGQAVQERIIALLEEADFPHSDVFGMRLALEEAIVNAIKHGNRLDPAKQVRIDCEIDDRKVSVTIEDEGEGFDPHDVPDPTEEDNLELPCGRGIMLMKHFLSRVEYNETGNRVTLEKERSPEENTPSP